MAVYKCHFAEHVHVYGTKSFLSILFSFVTLPALAGSSLQLLADAFVIKLSRPQPAAADSS